MHRARFHTDLAATCSGSTRNDTLFLHPCIAEHVIHMAVEAEHQFDVHTPLIVEFDFSDRFHPKRTWNIPNTWATFAPPQECIGEFYKPLDFDIVFANQDDIDTGSLGVLSKL